jgi:magnesium-dependent phosphatase 1
MKDVFDSAGGGHPADCAGAHIQIGRSPPLSSNKTTHFARIAKGTGVAYPEMLFFDDCSWSDNCAVVRRGCAGVVTQKTPVGLNLETWSEGLKKYAKVAAGN